MVDTTKFTASVFAAANAVAAQLTDDELTLLYAVVTLFGSHLDVILTLRSLKPSSEATTLPA